MNTQPQPNTHNHDGDTVCTAFLPSPALPVLAALLATVLALTSAQLARAAAFVTPEIGADVSRSTGYAASSLVNNAGSHGTVDNPGSAIWTYKVQKALGSDTFDLNSSTTLTNLPYSGDRQEFYVTAGTGDYAAANAAGLRRYAARDSQSWGDGSWELAIYTELADQMTYAIGGTLSWSLAYAAANDVAIIIAKVGTNGAVSEELFRTSFSAAASESGVVFSDSVEGATPIPESLTGITLNQGERLVFALNVGTGGTARRIDLNDSLLTMTVVPEPAMFTLFAGCGVLAAVVFASRRRVTRSL
ncbi:hypothetical protein OpiT1DRAFT_03100 [Opitutaceae bacterium TAV1]|nr:hypothetical protein OpiT1DRAFT_03100 [Opitutaceae bacterium TAV1]